MSEVDINYELKVLKMMLNTYLDESVSVTEQGLKSLEANRDQVVWELATKIYSQSGHKVELYTARDVVNSRIEVIDAKLTAKKKRIEAQLTAEKKRMEAQLAEQARQAAEKERIVAERKHIVAEKIRMGCLNKDDIFIKVQKVISKHLGVGENKVHLDSHIANDLGADSLNGVALMMALEEEFDIEIPDEVAEEISTVQFAVDYIIYAKLSA